MVTIREYIRPKSLEEAWELNQKKQNRIIAGMLWTKMSKANVQTAIDLSGLHLDTISEAEDAFHIGCMTTLRQLEMHDGLSEYTNGAMKEAVRHIVGVQFRNLATIGGSIFGRYGFSDVLTIFLALNADVELYKGGMVPLSEFVNMPLDNDILVAVHVKKTSQSCCYQSVRNTKTDFPVLTCAASYGEDGWRFAIGARPGKAVLLLDEKHLLASGVTEEAIKEFAAYAKENVKTSSNLRGSAEYRTHLVGGLVERAIRRLEGGSSCR